MPSARTPDFMFILTGGGIALLLFLLSTVLARTKKNLADRCLIVYLSFALVWQIYLLLEHAHIFDDTYWMLLGKGAYLLQAPVFFLYILAFTKRQRIRSATYLLLFLPFVAFALHFLYYRF